MKYLHGQGKNKTKGRAWSTFERKSKRISSECASKWHGKGHLYSAAPRHRQPQCYPPACANLQRAVSRADCTSFAATVFRTKHQTSHRTIHRKYGYTPVSPSTNRYIFEEYKVQKIQRLRRPTPNGPKLRESQSKFKILRASKKLLSPAKHIPNGLTPSIQKFKIRNFRCQAPS